MRAAATDGTLTRVRHHLCPLLAHSPARAVVPSLLRTYDPVFVTLSKSPAVHTAVRFGSRVKRLSLSAVEVSQTIQLFKKDRSVGISIQTRTSTNSTQCSGRIGMVLHPLRVGLHSRFFETLGPGVLEITRKIRWQLGHGGTFHCQGLGQAMMLAGQGSGLDIIRRCQSYLTISSQFWFHCQPCESYVHRPNVLSLPRILRQPYR